MFLGMVQEEEEEGGIIAFFKQSGLKILSSFSMKKCFEKLFKISDTTTSVVDVDCGEDWKLLCLFLRFFFLSISLLLS